MVKAKNVKEGSPFLASGF